MVALLLATIMIMGGFMGLMYFNHENNTVDKTTIHAVFPVRPVFISASRASGTQKLIFSQGYEEWSIFL